MQANLLINMLIHKYFYLWIQNIQALLKKDIIKFITFNKVIILKKVLSKIGAFYCYFLNNKKKNCMLEYLQRLLKVSQSIYFYLAIII